MFDLSSDSSSDAFMRIRLIHPLLIGNEFMTPPIALSEEAQNDYELFAVMPSNKVGYAGQIFVYTLKILHML
jgi:hypothetical protein